MAQITTGIRRLLSHPLVYSFSQLCLGATRGRKTFVRDYIRPNAHDKVLDIGCGTAEILNFLPDTVEYTGIDLSHDYIQYAKHKFSHRGTFICQDLNDVAADLPKFDIVLATGLLHHLDDNEAQKLFNIAASCLKPNGRIITIDCCYVNEQSSLAKFIISRDRGQNIRSPEEYLRFAKSLFKEVKGHVLHNLIRIPYTHFIMECSAI